MDIGAVMIRFLMILAAILLVGGGTVNFTATGLLGTVRAQLALRHMMVGVNAYPVNVPQVMIAGAAQKFDAEGRLTDQPARDLISQHLQALVKLAHKLKA